LKQWEASENIADERSNIGLDDRKCRGGGAAALHGSQKRDES
jgi:hypothetical protein